MAEKVIRDIVFGYIELSPQNIKVLDTPIFQRLRRIRQLTAFALYPSANQTRFEHSLGVMHLGRRVFRTLAEAGDIARIAEASNHERESLESTVEHACLLHDIGHAAFSHVGEAFYDRNEILDDIKVLDPKVYEAIGGQKTAGAKHELMSCCVILRHYRGLLPAAVDIELACRMITKSHYGSGDVRKRLNPLIAILNSRYDVDRLDYVLRDSVTTGTMGVSVDVERILRGYSVQEDILLFLRKALPSVVGLITGRDFLYQWLYNHHTVAYTDLLVEMTLKELFCRKDRKDLFSAGAVEKGIDDHTIWELLRVCWHNRTGQAYRLFERKFHRALWKTSYDFGTCKDISESKKDLLLVTCKGEGGGADSERGDALAAQLQQRLRLPPNAILICMRPVKHFDPMTNRDVYFWVNGASQPYAKLCGQSAYAGKTDYPLVFYDHDLVKREAVLKAISEVD